MKHRFLIIVIALALSGCAATPQGPYSPMGEGDRNSLRAQELTQTAATLINNEPENYNPATTNPSPGWNPGGNAFFQLQNFT